MTHKRSNLVLIGMPGSGKSTVGVILAKKTSREFVDTDILIQTSRHQSLQEIVNTFGYSELRKIEEEILLSLSVKNYVIATGGSAVYSNKSMSHLGSQGTLVFLDVDPYTLESRLHDFSTRGIAKIPGQRFSELFNERAPLYSSHADITINCNGLTQEDVCKRIIEETDIGFQP